MSPEQSLAVASGPLGVRLARRYPWLPFVLPLLVFMLLGSLEPARPDGRPQATEENAPAAGQPVADQTADERPAAGSWLAVPYRAYPVVYAVRLVLTAGTIVLFWPVYRQFAGRPGGLAIGVGVVGAVLWIALARLQIEPRLLALVGWGDLGERPAFNPFEQLAGSPALAWAFLVLRFAGLVLVVPVIEEFFLRAFVMRWVMDPDWEKIPFGVADARAIAAGTLVPMLMHPAELLAAAVWFSLVTWLMLRTRSIWSCIAAHAITNLLLGLWVLASGDWFLL